MKRESWVKPKSKEDRKRTKSKEDVSLYGTGKTLARPTKALRDPGPKLAAFRLRVLGLWVMGSGFWVLGLGLRV